MFNEILAPFFDKWKVSSPTSFAIVAALLIAAKAALIALTSAGLLGVDVSSIINWLTFIVALFLGSRTTGYLPQKSDESTESATIPNLIEDYSDIQFINPIKPEPQQPKKPRGRPRKH